MLVLDPAKRLSLSQIREHRWMMQEVPSQRPVLYRQGMTAESKAGLGEHSEQVLRLMHSLGIDQHKTIEVRLAFIRLDKQVLAIHMHILFNCRWSGHNIMRSDEQFVHLGRFVVYVCI